MKKILSFAAAAMMLTAVFSCGEGNPKDEEKKVEVTGEITFKTQYDSLAYSYGVMMGTQYSNFQDKDVVVPGQTMDLETFLAAFVTAMRRDSANLKIDIKTAEAFIRDFQTQQQKKMMEEREAKVQTNKTQGAAFMAENAKKEGVKTLPSGLQIQTIKEGTGKKPAENSTVKVNYKGTLIDGTVFDQNNEVEFDIAHVVEGFREGLMNMKEGGKAILTIPSDLGYKDYGAGQTIEGGSTLQFEVELLKVVK